MYVYNYVCKVRLYFLINATCHLSCQARSPTILHNPHISYCGQVQVVFGSACMCVVTYVLMLMSWLLLTHPVRGHR